MTTFKYSLVLNTSGVVVGIITISLDDKVERRLRATVGKKKGALGGAIEEAVDRWLHDRKQEEARKRALALLERGFNMGGATFVRQAIYEDRMRELTRRRGE